MSALQQVPDEQTELDLGPPDYLAILQRYEGTDPALVRLDPNEVAVLTGLSLKTLEGWRNGGKELPFLKLGRRVQYLLSDVLDFMKRNTFTSTREAKGRDRTAPVTPSKRRARG